MIVILWNQSLYWQVSEISLSTNVFHRQIQLLILTSQEVETTLWQWLWHHITEVIFQGSIAIIMIIFPGKSVKTHDLTHDAELTNEIPGIL